MPRSTITWWGLATQQSKRRDNHKDFRTKSCQSNINRKYYINRVSIKSKLSITSVNNLDSDKIKTRKAWSIRQLDNRQNRMSQWSTVSRDVIRLNLFFFFFKLRTFRAVIIMRKRENKNKHVRPVTRLPLKTIHVQILNFYNKCHTLSKVKQTEQSPIGYLWTKCANKLERRQQAGDNVIILEL